MGVSTQKELSKRALQSLYRFLTNNYDKLGVYTKRLLKEKILNANSNVIYDSEVKAYFIKDESGQYKSIETMVNGFRWKW